MLRSQTVLTIHDLYTQGKNVQEIAQELGISRTTVRKYLTHPEAVIPKPRPPRPSKLDPFTEQIQKWVMEDHCTNCVTPVKGYHLSEEQILCFLWEWKHAQRLTCHRKVGKDHSMTPRPGKSTVPANQRVSQSNLDMAKATLL
jgi:transposase